MEQTITCKELVELVTDYLEGKLPENTKVVFEEHLKGCRGCTNYLEQIQQTIRLTGFVNEEDLSTQQRDDLVKLFQNWKKT